MRKPKPILFVLVLFYMTPAFSQIQFDSTAINLLLSDSLKYHRTYCRSSIIWDSFAHNSGNLLKIENTLYFIPDHYGAVFVMHKVRDSITVQRIDKTRFSGFAGSQYCFYDQQFYSFGGYGFWQTNGQLRTYVEVQKEWDIVKLNEVVPSNNFFTYYDPENRYLWCGMQDYINEVLSSQEFKSSFDAYRLDIGKHKWEKVGEMIYKPTNTQVQEGIFLETPYGVIVNSGGPKFQLWNFSKNIKYEIGDVSDSLRTHFVSKLNTIRYSPFYINKHILLYDHAKHVVFKSFLFDPGLLKVGNGEVYTLGGEPFKYYWLFSLLIVPLIWFYWKKQLPAGLATVPQNTHSHKDTSQLVTFSNREIETGSSRSSEKSFIASLTNLELELLKCIIKDSGKGYRTQADELNRILGTESKSMDVQKKHRSDVLISINRKYATAFGSNTLLVEKLRTDADKRLFEYFINSNASLDLLS